MRLLYIEGNKVAKYKKGGWVMKSELSYEGSNHGALMLKLDNIDEYERWDFEDKCVKTQSH